MGFFAQASGEKMTKDPTESQSRESRATCFEIKNDQLVQHCEQATMAEVKGKKNRGMSEAAG